MRNAYGARRLRIWPWKPEREKCICIYIRDGFTLLGAIVPLGSRCLRGFLGYAVFCHMMSMWCLR